MAIHKVTAAMIRRDGFDCFQRLHRQKKLLSSLNHETVLL